MENKSKVKAKAVSLDVRINPSAAIIADENLIKSCINGILGNAIRYSPKNGSISILCELPAATVKIIIMDNGPGFAQDLLDSSFELFTLGEDPIKLNYGLHLAMSKLIMEAHDGQIFIENLESGGACVTLIFPNPQKEVSYGNGTIT